MFSFSAEPYLSFRKLLPLVFSFVTLLSAKTEAVACKPEIYWSDTITICTGNTILLDVTNPNSTYYWSTGAATPTISITQSGTYWVTVTNPCGSVSDTIHVLADTPLFVDLGNDRSICSLSNTTLTAPYEPGAQYLWQDGSKSHQYTVTQPGTYWVKVTNSCGTFRDTVQIGIDDPPSVNLGPDITNCSPTTNTLSVSAASGTAVRWSTGATSSSISVSGSGVYWVKLTNACGVVTDTIKISFNPGASLNLGDTIGKCSNGSVILNTNISGGSFLWSTGAGSSSIVVQTPGLYWVAYNDACGTYSDSVYVVNSGKANVDIGPDTAICYGDTLVLDVGNLTGQIVWENSVTGKTYKVANPGTYSVMVDNGCGPSYDSIDVDVLPKPDSKVIDDTIFFCKDSTAEVDAGYWGPTGSYVWSNGGSSQKQVFNTPGNHWVEIRNACDTVLENFWLYEVAEVIPDLGPDSVVCKSSLNLYSNVSTVGNEFRWSTGDTTSWITVTATDTYWVEVTNDCGVYTDTVVVVLLSAPKDAPDVVRYCQGSVATIGPPHQVETFYQWSTGDTTHQITVNSPGIYIVESWNICDTIVDTVEVVEVYPVPVELGNDTAFCEPGVLYLDVTGYSPSKVRWSTGSRNFGLPITSSGTYWVEVENTCGKFWDTISVQVDPLPRRKLSDTTICIGSTAYLDVSQPGIQSYSWSNGSSASSISVTQEGWYSVEMINNCGMVKDSAFVRVDHPISQLDIGNDTVFCQGNLLLDAGSFGGATYLWQNGSKARKFLVTSSGEYYVTVSNTCNSLTDTIQVLITGPPKFVLGQRVTFCHGAILTLDARNPGSIYQWSTGDSTQSILVDTAGVYWVKITNDCGDLVDTVNVFVDYPMDGLELGPDTVICRGDQLVLSTGYPNANTTWSDGTDQPSITVTESGKYSVEVTNKCGEWSDSIEVWVLEVPVFSLGKDSGICAIDGSFPVSGPGGDLIYEWSNGDSVMSTVFYDSGYHWLTVRNQCFSYTDSIHLKAEYPLNLDLGKDTVLCFGESLLLNPGDIDYKLHWGGSQSGTEVEVSRPGKYWVWARNTCGTYSDTIQIFMDYPLDDSAEDTLICREDSALFKLSHPRYEVVWWDGSTDDVRWFPDEGSYPFSIMNKCGIFEKEYVVNFSNCDCPLYVANAFTPNGDGKNDGFRAIHDCPLLSFHISIFNRWGQLIFETYDVDEIWNGQSGGVDHPMGTYYYFLDYTYEVYGTERKRRKSGLINLIR